MNTKAITQRLTALEARQPKVKTLPEWWFEISPDLRHDITKAEQMTEGKPSADPFVLETANRLARFLSTQAKQNNDGVT